ncbi:retrotransposon-related protein [Tanacetum coccineum]
MGDPIAVQLVLPQCDPNGSLMCVPIKVLERKMVKVNNKLAVYVLVQWSNGSSDDATWQLATDLKKKFPKFSFDS